MSWVFHCWLSRDGFFGAVALPVLLALLVALRSLRAFVMHLASLRQAIVCLFFLSSSCNLQHCSCAFDITVSAAAAACEDEKQPACLSTDF